MAVIPGLKYSLLTDGANGIQVIVFSEVPEGYTLTADDISDNLPHTLDKISNLVLTSGAAKTYCKEADGVWREW